MILTAVPLTCFGCLDGQNAFLARLKIHRITIPTSHKHSKVASNSPRLSFLALHFILSIVLAIIQTIWCQKRTLCCGKSLPYLEADLPISTLHHCTKPFEQTCGNVLSANRHKCLRRKDTLLGSDWHEARQQQFAIYFHSLG